MPGPCSEGIGTSVALTAALSPVTDTYRELHVARPCVLASRHGSVASPHLMFGRR